MLSWRSILQCSDGLGNVYTALSRNQSNLCVFLVNFNMYFSYLQGHVAIALR